MATILELAHETSEKIRDSADQGDTTGAAEALIEGLKKAAHLGRDIGMKQAAEFKIAALALKTGDILMVRVADGYNKAALLKALREMTPPPNVEGKVPIVWCEHDVYLEDVSEERMREAGWIRAPAGDPTAATWRSGDPGQD